jgi:hypothetical protein
VTEDGEMLTEGAEPVPVGLPEEADAGLDCPGEYGEEELGKALFPFTIRIGNVLSKRIIESIITIKLTTLRASSMATVSFTLISRS